MINLDEILNDENDFLDIFEYLVKDDVEILDAYDLMIEKFSAEKIFDYIESEDKINYIYDRPTDI
uniref:hypothetical protein n=1 Tax=Aliarcobacter sp. TaxID=2321116 RepID=UPI004047FEE3